MVWQLMRKNQLKLKTSLVTLEFNPSNINFSSQELIEKIEWEYLQRSFQKKSLLIEESIKVNIWTQKAIAIMMIWTLLTDMTPKEEWWDMMAQINLNVWIRNPIEVKWRWVPLMAQKDQLDLVLNQILQWEPCQSKVELIQSKLLIREGEQWWWWIVFFGRKEMEKKVEEMNWYFLSEI